MKRFRETLWFKAGDVELATEDDDARAHFEATPLDVRYQGQVTADDSIRFGVHTGVTQPVPNLGREEGPESPVALAAVVRELTRVRGAFYAALGAVVVAAVAVVLLSSHGM